MTEEVYKCPYCGFTTSYYFAFMCHVKRTHGLAYCPICGKKVKNLPGHAYSKGVKGARSKEHMELFLLLHGGLKR
jgi:transcription elongation factor Elf1